MFKIGNLFTKGILSLGLLATSLLGADKDDTKCNEFRDFRQYGSHFYTVTIKKMTFDEAKIFAQKSGGYLAIPDNLSENNFIASIIKGGNYAWIGIHDPNFTQNHCLENKGCAYENTRFKTIKGKVPSFTKWSQKQPDNLLKEHDVITNEKGEKKEMVSPLGEHWVAIASRSGLWADMGNHAGEMNPYRTYAVIEYDTKPLCHNLPSPDEVEMDMTDKCSTWISDDPNYKIDNSRPSQIINCAKDTQGDLFCPANLVDCKQGGSSKVSGTSKRVEAILEYKDDKQITRKMTYSYYDYICPANHTAKDKGGNCNPSSPKDLIDTNRDGMPDSCPKGAIPPKENCVGTSTICPFNSSRSCVLTDGKYKCSPFPCFTNDGGLSGDGIENTDSPVGINDANNNGWNDDGSCSGQIFIFNGKDNRCRSRDKFGSGLFGGGCCNKDKVALGLVKCKEDEKNLAKLNKQRLCHYVGEYCSKKKKFIGCLQWKKSYCCFNGILARIFNEQGRPQISKGWGSGKHPDCRGFTPEEFQKLDFSKIDLTEFTNSLTINIDQNFAKQQAGAVKNKIEANLDALKK